MEYAQRHRLAIAALVAAACLALVAVWLAWPKASSTPAAAAAPVAAASPAAEQTGTSVPEWLGGQVQALLNRYTGGKAGAVSSLAWVKTTVGQYETAVNGGGDKASMKPVYVVVAHGKFTSEVGGEKDDPIAVTTVVLTFDVASRKPATVDALYKASSFDEATLGEVRPLTLPAVGE
jgi:hypothetical protein